MASRLQFSERGDRAVTEHFKRKTIADYGGYRKVKRDNRARCGFQFNPAQHVSRQGAGVAFRKIKTVRRNKNVDPIDTLQYARDLAEQRANLPADFDQARNLRLGLTAA